MKKAFKLLGCYDNFPKNFHGLFCFQYHDSMKGLQQAILCTFHGLNSETFDLSAVTPYLKQNCMVGFEVGVADSFDFNFLDHSELDQCLKSVAENELLTLDFFFAVRYHLIRDDGKRVPLKFDYHLLRFVFQEVGLKLQICHEKGTQRVPLDDLTSFLVKQINAGLSYKQLMPLFFGDFGKVNVK
jgi:hypothetical protein